MENKIDYKQKIKQKFDKIATYTNEYGYVHEIPKHDEIYNFIISNALPIYRQHLIKKIQKVKEMIQRDIGSFKYNDCYDDCLEIINKE